MANGISSGAILRWLLVHPSTWRPILRATSGPIRRRLGGKSSAPSPGDGASELPGVEIIVGQSSETSAEIETDRLRLSSLQPADLHEMTALDVVDLIRKIKRHRLLWTIREKENGRCAGVVVLLRIRWADGEEYEIGYEIAPSMRGQGFATEASAAVRDFVFSQLGANRVASMIEPGNAPSIRVAAKNGFAHVADANFSGHRVGIYVANSQSADD